MEHVIENEKLKVSIADHGAEIRSVIRKSDGKEIMWQADPAYWGRTSPVLFPLVGNYYEKKSVYNGKTYEMGQHGFARDMDFSVIEEKPGEIAFILKDDASSHEKYPFAFELIIRYVLADNTIKVGFNQKLEDREYGNTLGAGESFNAGYEMFFAAKTVSETPNG